MLLVVRLNNTDTYCMVSEVASNNIQFAAPKAPSFDGNVSKNNRRFEEDWNLFEKTLEEKGS